MENSNFKVRCKPACFGTKKRFFDITKSVAKKCGNFMKISQKFLEMFLNAQRKVFYNISYYNVS